MGDPAFPPPPPATGPTEGQLPPQPPPPQPPPPQQAAEPPGYVPPGEVPPPYPGPTQHAPLQPGYKNLPPPSYQQQQQQQQWSGGQQQNSTTVVINQQQQPGQGQAVIVQSMIRFGDHPVAMRCPTCNNQISTMVTREAGMMVWIMIAIIFFLGFWLGCCLIPLCIPSFHDAVHSCPVCKSKLGVCKKL